MIRTLPPSEARLLLPLNAVVQDIHAQARPDLFCSDPPDDALERFFSDWLRRDGVFAVVSEDADGPNGYALFEQEDRAGSVLLKAERRGVLHHIAVAPHARRQGIARSMTEFGKVRLKEAGCTRLCASYHAFNTGSRGLMAHLGFRLSVSSVELPL